MNAYEMLGIAKRDNITDDIVIRKYEERIKSIEDFKHINEKTGKLRHALRDSKGNIRRNEEGEIITLEYYYEEQRRLTFEAFQKIKSEELRRKYNIELEKPKNEELRRKCDSELERIKFEKRIEDINRKITNLANKYNDAIIGRPNNIGRSQILSYPTIDRGQIKWHNTQWNNSKRDNGKER